MDAAAPTLLAEGGCWKAGNRFAAFCTVWTAHPDWLTQHMKISVGECMHALEESITCTSKGLLQLL